jgi:integrase
MAARAEGIDERHARSCRSRDDGGRCNCSPSFQVNLWDGRSQKRIRKTFRTLTEAKAWRQDAAGALRAGTLRASDGRTVKEVADKWIEEARPGLVRNRSGDVYKPKAVRSYAGSLRLHVFPELGARKFSHVRRVDVKNLVDKLHKEGLSPSTVLCSILPLKAIYRRAVARGEVPINPTSGLEMPAIRGKRDRIVSPEQAVTLLAALKENDRPLWATAMYAGLRCGELQALRWEDVEFLDGVIHVRRGWDAVEGEIAPKSRTGIRRVPMPSILRECLEALYARSPGNGLVFGNDGSPFDPRRVAERAKAAWKARDLGGLTLHECRHTYASFMIAAGANAKAVSTYLGHATIAITMDRYGHLMPGNEAEAADLLDVFLAGARN